MAQFFRKFLKYLAYGLVVVILLLLILWYRPTFTPGIKGTHAISELTELQINGQRQTILIRGEDISNPIVLFLHGGPGMPLMYLGHAFQRPLEEHFTIVQWDQRASGKSYQGSTDPETINVRQFLDDTEYLVNYLTRRFGKDRVILVGHSWGTYLGSIFVSRHPELIKTYISVGQVVDYELEKDAQRQFLLKEATARNDQEALNLIKRKGGAVFEEFLFKYGGELHLSKTYYPLIWAGVRAEEYNLRDVMHVAKGSSFCSSNMVYNALPDRSILKNIPEYKVPIYFFTGRHDMTTPASLIEDYFREIDAPDKKIVWFQESAHFPFFEEPEKFCSKFIELLK